MSLIFIMTFNMEQKIYQENGEMHSFPPSKVRLELSSLLIRLKLGLKLMKR